MVYVAEAVEPIARYGWGAVTLAGVSFACVIMFASSALIFGWRYLYPSPSRISVSSHDRDRESPATNDPAVDTKIEGLETQLDASNKKLDSFARLTVSASESQSKRLELTNSQLSELSSCLSKIENVLRPQEKGLLAQAFLKETDGTRLGGIESRLEMLRADMNKALEAIEAR
jgi:hypothetical protein